MVTLRIGIGDVRLVHPQHFFQARPDQQAPPGAAQPNPPLAAADYVVNGGQGELLMGEMTV